AEAHDEEDRWVGRVAERLGAERYTVCFDHPLGHVAPLTNPRVRRPRRCLHCRPPHPERPGGGGGRRLAAMARDLEADSPCGGAYRCHWRPTGSAPFSGRARRGPMENGPTAMEPIGSGVDFDVVVIGAGITGIHQLYQLRE